MYESIHTSIDDFIKFSGFLRMYGCCHKRACHNFFDILLNDWVDQAEILREGYALGKFAAIKRS